MQGYIKTRIENYNIALGKIQEAIEDCGRNNLWDIVENLEKGKFELIDIIKEDEELLSKYN